MKNLLILGAGTSGTIIANRIVDVLDPAEWKLTVVDREPFHYYQPGFLYIPFGLYTPEDVIRPKRNLLPSHVRVFFSEIERVDPVAQRVYLTEEKRVLHYDELVIATGCDPLTNTDENVFDFYSLANTKNLSRFLNFWKGGDLTVYIGEDANKYPVAALEFLYLADWFFRERGLREFVNLTYATSASTAFDKPVNSPLFWHLCKEKGIELVTRTEVQQLHYDVLVTVPKHVGARFIGEAGLGNTDNFAYVHPQTLQSSQYDNIWVIGDAADLPIKAKTGSAAHFMTDTLTENLYRHIKGLLPLPKYDGHATYMIDTGYEKAVLLDFDDDLDPQPGKYPLPGFGPFPLLEESPLTYRGKRSLRWLYWNAILKGVSIQNPFILSREQYA